MSEFIKRQGRVSEAVARHFMTQIAAGLSAMRAQNLIHRDLKPQNLLLTTADLSPYVNTGGEAGEGNVGEARKTTESTLKIADFGFARYMHPTGMAETLCGSPLYMAPEILSYQKYDAKADLWSVGTILYELLVGRPPFTGMNPMQLLKNIERSDAKIPSKVATNLSRECISILRGLLRRNPVERMSFDDFFSHPFLTSGAPSRGLGQAAVSGETGDGECGVGTTEGHRIGTHGAAMAGGSSGRHSTSGSGQSGRHSSSGSGQSSFNDSSNSLSGDSSSQMPFLLDEDVGGGLRRQSEDEYPTEHNGAAGDDNSRRGMNIPRNPGPSGGHQGHHHTHRLSVEKAARGAAAVAMHMRDAAATAAGAAGKWLSTSPMARRQYTGPGTWGSGSPRPIPGAAKPPLSSSPSSVPTRAFNGFKVNPNSTAGSQPISAVPFAMQGSRNGAGNVSSNSLAEMEAEYVFVDPGAEANGSPSGLGVPAGVGSSPKGRTGMGLLARRISGTIGSVVGGGGSKQSTPQKQHQQQPQQQQQHQHSIEQVPQQPSQSFGSKPSSLGSGGTGLTTAGRNTNTTATPITVGNSGSRGGSAVVTHGFSSGCLVSPPSVSPSAAAAAAAMAAMAVAAAAPNAAASTPAQRMSTLERAAGVLRDTAMEKWEAGKRLDAVSLSLVSLTALREAVALASAAAAAAARAEAEAIAADDCGTDPDPKKSISTSASSKPMSQSRSLVSNATQTLQKIRREKERSSKTLERMKSSFAAALTRADRAIATLKPNTPGGAKLPDGMELAYEAALHLGRAGAVEELMGNLGASLNAYARSQTLLMFLLSEGPDFQLTPPSKAFSTESEAAHTAAAESESRSVHQMPPGFPSRSRVARFATAISARQTACAVAAGCGTTSTSSRSSMKMSPSSSGAVSLKMAAA